MPRRQMTRLRRRTPKKIWIWAGFAGGLTVGAVGAAVITGGGDDRPPALATGQTTLPAEFKELLDQYLAEQGYHPAAQEAAPPTVPETPPTVPEAAPVSEAPPVPPAPPAPAQAPLAWLLPARERAVASVAFPSETSSGPVDAPFAAVPSAVDVRVPPVSAALGVRVEPVANQAEVETGPPLASAEALTTTAETAPAAAATMAAPEPVAVEPEPSAPGREREPAIGYPGPAVVGEYQLAEPMMAQRKKPEPDKERAEERSPSREKAGTHEKPAAIAPSTQEEPMDVSHEEVTTVNGFQGNGF
ncbi:hypothetical protein [Amycolatopsis anabasis]|uniref:hypothetical protein n=1 Tax=Amycolatopsis anabasis TaxID=1840409 RepID=UPI00131BD0B6|nr:hypothetical protein [Amycolatopsis anabasis]